jgi:hypothetical protein
MSDEQLRRQFQIAREIHRGGKSGVLEVLVPVDDPATITRSGIMTRRILTACAALVLVNVLIGLAVIAGKNRKKDDSAKEAGIRQQLSESLGAAAQNAMPPPTFESTEVRLTAPRAEWENIASRIISAATSFDGSATKGLPEESAVTVVADIPSAREKEFRQAVSSAATISPMPAIAKGADADAPTTSSPNERTVVQVRIAETAP